MIIQNGKVALSGQEQLKAIDIRVIDGKIVELGSNLSNDSVIIDAGGCWVFPGGIDPHVHFFDPGFTNKEDFYAGTCNSASGGITTIIDMPCTSIPAVTSLKNLENKLNVVKEKAVIDFGFYGGLSALAFDPGVNQIMKELAPMVLGFKCYLISGMSSFPSLSYFQLKQVLSYSKGINRPVLVHAEDPGFVEDATEFFVNNGSTPEDYYQSRPELAEVLAAQSLAALAKSEKANLHVVHIGTAEAADFLDQTYITGETCPQYLAFDLEDFKDKKGLLKIAPSIKQKFNQNKLWEQLAKGIISFIASDHAPGNSIEKNDPNIWKNSSGIAGGATIWPYMFSEGFMTQRLSLSRFLEVTAEAAAKRYGINNQKGDISVGKDADLILVNPNEDQNVTGEQFYSKSKQTPFEGNRFRGKIKKTIVRGMTVFDDVEGITAKKGSGKFITVQSG